MLHCIRNLIEHCTSSNLLRINRVLERGETTCRVVKVESATPVDILVSVTNVASAEGVTAANTQARSSINLTTVFAKSNPVELIGGRCTKNVVSFPG